MQQIMLTVFGHLRNYRPNPLPHPHWMRLALIASSTRSRPVPNAFLKHRFKVIEIRVAHGLSLDMRNFSIHSRVRQLKYRFEIRS